MKSLFSEAARLASLGYAVFPCIPNDKRPLTANGCNDATTDEDTIAGWWEMHPNANIGVATKGLIVVDVDTMPDGSKNIWSDATERQAELLSGAGTHTPRGGSHYWFKQPEWGSWRNTASKIAERVDTRADGGYVLVPHSTTSAGKYSWITGWELDKTPSQLPEPPKWLIDKLITVVPKVARVNDTTVSASGNAIPEGSRNATLASLGGTMRRSGFGEEEIYAALCAANRTRCHPMLDDDEVRRIAHSVARYEPDQFATIIAEGSTIGGIAKNKLKPNPGLLPNELLHVPGLIGDFVAWSEENAFIKQPILSLAAGIAMMGSLTGRKIEDETGTRTNIYCVGVCESGGGKDNARKAVKKLLTLSGCEKLIGPEGIASSAGLISTVENEPCSLMQLDEFGMLLTVLKESKGSPHLYKITTELMKLFTSSSTVFVGDAYAKLDDVKRITQPNLCIYGTTVIRSLTESLTTESLSNGLVGRLLVFEAPSGVKTSRGIVATDCPAELITQVGWWRDYRPGGAIGVAFPQPRRLATSPDAAEAFESLLSHAEERRQAGLDESGIWSRALEKSKKLALIHAASSDPMATWIGGDSARWAIAVVRHLTESLEWMAERYVSDGKHHETCNRILRAAEASGSDGISLSDLWGVLRRGTTPRERAEAIADLTESGEIRVDLVAGTGRPRQILRLATHTGEHNEQQQRESPLVRSF